MLCAAPKLTSGWGLSLPNLLQVVPSWPPSRDLSQFPHHPWARATLHCHTVRPPQPVSLHLVPLTDGAMAPPADPLQVDTLLQCHFLLPKQTL